MRALFRPIERVDIKADSPSLRFRGVSGNSFVFLALEELRPLLDFIYLLYFGVVGGFGFSTSDFFGTSGFFCTSGFFATDALLIAGALSATGALFGALCFDYASSVVLTLASG